MAGKTLPGVGDGDDDESGKTRAPSLDSAVPLSISTPELGVPITAGGDERAFKGTLHGRSVHLPDEVPDEADETRPVVALSTDVVPMAEPLHPHAAESEFSHGDANFFDSAPVS